MTINEYAVLEWRCQACGGECRRASRENDGFDLECEGCGRAYVVTNAADTYAMPAGA
jgi:hypothetical protein